MPNKLIKFTATLEQHSRTKEQWRVVDGDLVVSAWQSHEVARRILACWNVCQGISTEDIETLAVARKFIESGRLNKSSRQTRSFAR